MWKIYVSVISKDSSIWTPRDLCLITLSNGVLLTLTVKSLFICPILYIGLFLFSNEGRGVSFVTDGIVDSVLMN